jgi:hypothetical protein
MGYFPGFEAFQVCVVHGSFEAPHRATSDLPRRYRVVIVGAGWLCGQLAGLPAPADAAVAPPLDCRPETAA